MIKFLVFLGYLPSSPWKGRKRREKNSNMQSQKVCNTLTHLSPPYKGGLGVFLNQSFVAIIYVFHIILFWFSNPKVATAETNPRSDSFCVQELPQKIDEIITDPESASHWGIMIQPWFSQEILYQRNANQFFIPASTVKLFTSAIALNQLNPNFQIVTPIYTEGNPPDLEELKIIGRGDPTLTTNDLETLAETLKKQGVRSIKRIVLETGYLPSPTINSTWEWEDVYAAYGTGINDFILDENSVTLTLRPQAVGEAVSIAWNNALAASQWKLNNQATTTPPNTDYQIELQGNLGTSQLSLSGKLPQRIKADVWNLAIPNPNHYFRDQLLNTLAKQGITVNQVQFLPISPTQMTDEKMMTFASPPLEELIGEVNRESNNLYAEALLKVLIAETNPEMIEEGLIGFGIFPSDYQLTDGSGLSRRNLATPSAIAQLLQGMLSSENAETFQSSLAVAGVSGTLKKRFQGTELQENLQGKTGTLTGISALSGYVNPPSYQPLVFSLLLNHSQLSASQQREKIDRILLLLSQIKQCYDRVIS